MKRRYIFSILFFIIFTVTKSQQTEQYKKTLEEHLEVMLDNTYYLAGESVFYTIAYSSEKNGHNPEGITIFAELLDSVNFRLASACNRIDAAGYSRGALPIPASASTGYYILRFYTYQMMAHGPQTYQYKLIPVLNPEKGLPVVREKDRFAGLHIEFRPEGNHWVSGLENKMVMKCLNFAGQLLNCQAFIIQNQRIIDTLTFDQNGTASLRVIPYQDSLMKLFITIPDSTQKEFLFPIPEKNGTTLFVDRLVQDTLLIYIGQNTTLIQKEEYTLFLKVGRKIISNVLLTLNSNDTILSLPIDTLADGSYTLLLTDKNKQILNCTTFSLKKQNDPEIHIHDTFHKCGDSIQFEIRFQDAKYAPQRIAVRANLTPDISKKLNLDCKFDYKDIYLLQNFQTDSYQLEKRKRIPPDGKGIIISGFSKYRSTGEPAAYLPIQIVITNGRKDIYKVCTDSLGMFYLVLKRIYGKVNAIFQPIGMNKKQEIDIILFPQFSDEYLSYHIPKLIFSESQVVNLNELAKISFVERNSAAKTKPLESEKSDWVFYGKADEVIEMNDYIELPHMEEVFRELSRFIILSGSGKNIRIQVLDKYTNRIIGNNPLLLIDGVPMESHSEVLSIKPSIVERIAVVAGKYFYRSSRFDGIVDIELKKRSTGFTSASATLELDGYTDSQENDQAHYSSFSRCRYWQPFLKGENGLFKGSFMIGAIPGTYTIYVEGKDLLGRRVCKEHSIKVK